MAEPNSRQVVLRIPHQYRTEVSEESNIWSVAQGDWADTEIAYVMGLPIQVNALDLGNLLYVPVERCRVAATQAGRGVIPQWQKRNLIVHGAAAKLKVQADSNNCLYPKANGGPVSAAVEAMIVVVPATTLFTRRDQDQHEGMV